MRFPNAPIIHRRWGLNFRFRPRWRGFTLLLTCIVERRVKRDSPTRCKSSNAYYQPSIPTWFGHHYAHHQENKTVYYCIWCSELVVLAVVVWSWVVSCVHCVKIVFGALCEGYCSVNCAKVTVRCTVWRLFWVQCVKFTIRCTVWRSLFDVEQ